MSAIRFIAGSGRSGTTWVLDCLSAANGLRPVFEPLNPYVSRIGRVYAHRTLLPGETHPDLRNFLERVFAGRRARLWTQYRRQRRWLLPTAGQLTSRVGWGRYVRRLLKFAKESPGLAVMAAREEPLVKCIWANLMLGWIREQFGCRILLIVRHPGAVIESELRSEWQADDTLERFRNDRQLSAATGDRYGAMLHRKMSAAEALTLRWLVENQPLMEEASRSELTIVHYEHLARQLTSAWKQACSALDLGCLPARDLLMRPSQQSSPQGSTARPGADGKAMWQVSLTTEQTDQIQGMLERANFKAYDVFDPEPRMSAGHATKAEAGS